MGKLKIKKPVKKAGSNQKHCHLAKLKEHDTKDDPLNKLEENFRKNVEEKGIEASSFHFKEVLGSFFIFIFSFKNY